MACGAPGWGPHGSGAGHRGMCRGSRVGGCGAEAGVMAMVCYYCGAETPGYPCGSCGAVVAVVHECVACGVEFDEECRVGYCAFCGAPLEVQGVEPAPEADPGRGEPG